MRGLSVTLVVLVSTAWLSAQQRPAPPPPRAPSPPPIVLPYPPLPTQPTGGFTSGFVYPTQINPAYRPSTSGRGGRAGYGGYPAYGGGYFYAPDTTPAPTGPAPAQEPTGELRLTGTPADAQVFVDGFYMATLGDVEDHRALTLTAGPHHVEVRAPDYTSERFDVRIDPSAMVSYHASLDHVRAQPSRAAAPRAGATKMYLIPNCYLGNVPPKPERLPKGCDIKRVQEIS